MSKELEDEYLRVHAIKSVGSETDDEEDDARKAGRHKKNETEVSALIPKIPNKEDGERVRNRDFSKNFLEEKLPKKQVIDHRKLYGFEMTEEKKKTAQEQTEANDDYIFTSWNPHWPDHAGRVPGDPHPYNDPKYRQIMWMEPLKPGEVYTYED
jgi:hypothetical protein